MKIFFFSKTHKSVCIMLISMPDGISLEMQDLFFPKVSLSITFFLFFLLQKFSSWTFWSEQDLFHALTAREPLAGLGLAIMPQTAPSFFLQTLTNAEHLPPTAFTVRSQSHQTPKKTKQYLLHSLAMIPGELFVWKCFLSYRLLQFSFSKWKCWSWV